MLGEITNFVQLTTDVGTSGQPTSVQFKQILFADYVAVINLAMPDSENAITTEGSIVTGLGMTYIHIPVPFDDPTIDDLRLFIHVMDGFLGSKVWVHCVKNYRVSAFMFHYLRLRRSYSEADAKSSVFDYWSPNLIWQTFMQIPLDSIDFKTDR